MQWTWDSLHLVWAAGVLLHIVLLAVLFACGRIRRFPLFTLLVIFYVVRSLALYVTTSRISRAAYSQMHIGFAIADTLLETVVLLSLCWQGVKGLGIKPRFVLPGAFLVIAAAASLPLFWGKWPAAIIWPGQPGFDGTAFASLFASKGNVFVQGLAIVVAIVVLAASRRTGLLWTSHIRRLTQGFSTYALVTIAITAVIEHLEATLKPTSMAEYQAAISKLTHLSYVPTGVYFVVVVYWIVTLWMPDGVVLSAPAESAAIDIASI